MDTEFSKRVSLFLNAPKFAVRGYRWRGKASEEYVKARFPVAVELDGKKRIPGDMILTAHRYRSPPKYSFVLLYRGVRVLALDVDPARTHTNPITLEVIRSTHWHAWPCDDAHADSRSLGHQEWFREFLKRGKIDFPFRYVPPPYGMQLELKI